jgi:serine/threonine-protein kinase RsbW
MRRLMRAFETFADAQKVTDPARHDMYVALDEIISNAVKYGGRGPRGRMTLALKMRAGDLCVTFADDGIAFNPLEVQAPDISVELSERQIGGLGIFLVRHLMDEMKYARRSGKNFVVMVKKIHRS